MFSVDPTAAWFTIVLNFQERNILPGRGQILQRELRRATLRLRWIISMNAANVGTQIDEQPRDESKMH